MKKLFILSLICVTLSSCSGLNKDEKIQAGLKTTWNEFYQESFSSIGNVKVYVVTDRKFENGNAEFGCTDRHFGINLDPTLKFGTCLINVPKNHKTGEIETSKDDRKSSNDIFKIVKTTTTKESDLIGVIKNSDRTPLVFVHGFNVRYQEAVLRAAQIAYDLKYQGPVILFTWPAGSGDGFFDDALLNKTYPNNLISAKASITPFKNFLLNLKKNNIHINLMVHSMGHQVALPALQQLGQMDAKNPFINELILNAPDFDAAEFLKIAKMVKSTSKHATLYCSYNDKAMTVSESFNKGKRLGACAFSDDIDSINVSLVDDPTLGLGHSYYSSRPILSDVFQTILGIDAEKRLFIRKSEPNSKEKYYLRP